jgi:hypothetical protein
MLSNQNLPKICPRFYCEKCDYGTSKKSSYDDHLNSKKHCSAMFINKILPKFCSEFICKKCNKKYKDNSGLWRHKQKCKLIYIDDSIEENISGEPTDKQLIMMLIKDNSELKNILMEVVKNGTHNTTNNTNSHNKSFNLQFFLNETCKNAMNIMDFVESIQLQLSDLEKVGELGYVDGISNIIIKNLNALDITQRPIHCTDKKREVLYVKDEDLWEKQDQHNKKVRNVIKKITDKNMRLIPQYKQKYPDCNKSESKISDKYNTIVVESMGGKGENYFEKENKIITNITKEIVVGKE